MAETSYERNSQTLERRRSLFPQNSVDSGEDSDLDCFSPLSSSSFDDDEDSSSGNLNNLEDYDIIGIVRKDINVTSEATPDKDYPALVIDESPLTTTPHSKIFDCQLPSTSKDQNSPSSNLKTPHDTLTINTKLPRLTHKSVTDPTSAPSKRKLSPYNSPEFLNKSLKVDIKNSKVRTTLFPETDLVLPTKRFYSNTESVMEQIKEQKKKSSESLLEQMKERRKKSVSSSVNSRRHSKRKHLGKINAGVKHSIRKPKQRKSVPLSLVRGTLSETENNALKYYLDNLKELKSADTKKLIENKENAAPNIPALSLSTAELPDTVASRDNLFANNQVFCSGFQNAPSTTQSSINTLQYSTMAQCSTALPQYSTNISQNNSQYFTTNNVPINPFSTNRPFTTPSTSISVSGNVESSKKRSLSSEIEEPNQSKKFFKFSRSQKGVVTMNKSMKLMVDHGKVSLIGSSTSMTAQQPNQPEFESEDVTVEEPMSEVVMNILSTLEDENGNDVNKNEKQESTICSNFQNQAILTAASSSITMMPSFAPGSIVASTSNPANLILSPISQMCDVTSGLALNSPKRAKNLSSLIENVSRSPKNQLLMSPKGHLITKKKTPSLVDRKFKKLHKDQMLLDAGQKKFGVTQCTECNFVYHVGDPSDEVCHMNYHEALPVLKFGVSRHSFYYCNVGYCFRYDMILYKVLNFL